MQVGRRDLTARRAIIDSTRASPTGFLRGFEPRAVTGNTYHLANLEYRQHLLELEVGASTLPLYLKRIHFALLADAGLAYDDTSRSIGCGSRSAPRSGSTP